MGEMIGKVAIVGEQQEAGAVLVQPPRRVQPETAVFFGEEADHRLSPPLVAEGGDDPGGLVQHEGHRLLRFQAERPAVQRDAVSRAYRMAEIGDYLAVDSHALLLDGIGHFAAGADAGSGQGFEQGFRLHFKSSILWRVFTFKAAFSPFCHPTHFVRKIPYPVDPIIC